MNSLVQYYQNLNQSFLEDYSRSVPGYNVETIHNMRVAIKKIKAFFLFLEFCNKRFIYKKIYSGYKAVFQETGAIRDLQVQQEHIRNWQEKYHADFGDYEKMLKYREVEKQVSFSYLFENTDKSIFDKSGIVASVNIPNMKKSAASYIRETLKMIFSFDIFQVSSFEEIHEYRKKLKELQYNLSFIQSATPEIKINILFLRKLKDLTETLGLWHDNFILLTQLYDFKKTYVRHIMPKYDAISILERKYYRGNYSYFKRIDTKHRAFLQKAEILRNIC